MTNSDIKDGNTINSFKVTMFGGFSISGMGTTVSDEMIHSKMLVKLLAYIISHRKGSVSVQELVDALWTDEDSDDPAAALKNLMYRLRKYLGKIWGETGTKLILTGKGAYYWNENIGLEVDTEEFMRLVNDATYEKDEIAKTNMLIEACDIYRGSYMTGYDYEYWITSDATFYNSMYLSTVKKAATLLETQERYADIERITSKAFNIEMLDEEIHVWFIKALEYQGKHKLAMDQYQKSTSIIYDNLGISKPEKLMKVYDFLMAQSHDATKSIKHIEDELKEEATSDGAFFCEYGVFKQIYHLELRRAERLGISVFLSLVSIGIVVQGELPDDEKVSLLADAMERCKHVLSTSLRSGDVVTRYSNNQFILLLPTCQFETAMRVLERIERAFYRKYKTDAIKIHFSLDEME